MSEIQTYKQKKALADRLAMMSEKARGVGQCDKFGARVTLSDCHVGYYGNSSCCGWADDVTRAVVAQIEGHWPTLFKWAADAAAADAEKARKEAEAEAREVLAEVAESRS